MEKILDKIESPQDLKRLKLTIKDKKQLAKEIRTEIIENVSKTGGHLASNLGVVELTIAIHSVFDTPTDKVIWDVGHQSYVHKMLTGRKDKFSGLRQLNGISGFPKVSESEYDVFNTGHSSTSISAALGMARARDIKKENYRVIAVIGDGALTGGMALEALNDAGASGSDMIVILNDNEMSIEKNTGGLAMALTKMRTRKFYTNSNIKIKRAVSKIPGAGDRIIRFVRRVKYSIKQLLLPNMFFEDIGFKYLGPVDGNDMEKIEEMLRKAKDLSGPVLIHCKTVKGKGYEPAEKNPNKFHSSAAFDVETGNPIKEKKKDYSKVFGDKLVQIAEENKNVVAITAAMTSGTGLTEFAEEYPDRFFDVEIAEQHALTMAAGLSVSGLVPVVAIYSSFLQRAYDQLIHDICMQNLHVVICIDRAGIVGADGETHQGLFDMAFLRLVPNLTIMAPQDFDELENMMDLAINKMTGPVAIRYPRGGESKLDIKEEKENQMERLEKGKALVLKEGTDVSIIAIGKMVVRGMEVAKKLEEKNINAEVINVSFLKPFDRETVKNSIIKTKNVITIEDGTLIGGLNTTVSELITEEKLKDIELKGFGYADTFIQHGRPEELEKMYGLDAETICEYIIK